MLSSLHISNYVLIESLDINFETGFSVITGETGAGKSILLGAVELLLGQRADSKILREGADKCVVEGRFNLTGYGLRPLFQENDLDYDEEECIFRREWQSTGKSRSFINDTPVSLGQMKEIGRRLLDIHSQHQNLLLYRRTFPLEVTDMVAGDERERAAYLQVYNRYKADCTALEQLKVRIEKNRSEEEFIRFQYEELEKASLKSGEQEEIEQEADLQGHAEEIFEKITNTVHRLDEEENGALQTLSECERNLRDAAKVYSPAKEWADRVENCLIDLKDLCRDLEVQQEKTEFNPERLAQLQERLNLIYSLQQKHRTDTVEGLLETARTYGEQLQNIDRGEEEMEQLALKVEEEYNSVRIKARTLSGLRGKAMQRIEQEMTERLMQLGMPNIQFKAELISKEEYGSAGCDEAAFWFSANKNGRLQLLSEVASGGEMSRVMLAVKAMIARKTMLPTIIFDEIDTGLSGSMAERMACVMQEMGNDGRQVISITHLPQIAAHGTSHYKVYKQDTAQSTQTVIRRLAEEERVEEIARMMSGEKITEAALNNARALLNKPQ